MMTCREVVEFLWQYHSGDLPDEERARFEAHLSRCVGCATYLRGYRETIRLTRVALLDPDAAVSARVPEELIQAILAARAAAPPGPARRPS
jgi:anti-sigma factor RsiW